MSSFLSPAGPQRWRRARRRAAPPRPAFRRGDTNRQRFPGRLRGDADRHVPSPRRAGPPRPGRLRAPGSNRPCGPTTARSAARIGRWAARRTGSEALNSGTIILSSLSGLLWPDTRAAASRGGPSALTFQGDRFSRRSAQLLDLPGAPRHAYRQLRQLHLELVPLSRRARCRRDGSTQRSGDRFGRDRGAAGRDRVVARPVHAARGWHLPGPDPGRRPPGAHDGGVPRAPGDRRRLRGVRGARSRPDARQGFHHPAPGAKASSAASTGRSRRPAIIRSSSPATAWGRT